MILEAFREAGKALDDGELVCIFPGRADHPDGPDQSVPAGHGADRQGAGRADHPRAHRPGHVQHLQPDADPLAARADPAAGDGLVRRRRCLRRRLPSEIRRAIGDLDQEAWDYRKEDRRPLHSGVHPPRPSPSLPPGAGRSDQLPSSRSSRPWPRRSRWPGRFGRSGGTRRSWGSCCRRASAGVLVNMAASLSGRVVVNLNFTAGKAAMSSAVGPGGFEDRGDQPDLPREGRRSSCPRASR